MFPSVILSKKKGAFSVMLVNTLSFKDHLDLTNRLEIALEYLKQGGFYGVVTDLANAYNTNTTLSFMRYRSSGAVLRQAYGSLWDRQSR